MFYQLDEPIGVFSRFSDYDDPDNLQMAEFSGQKDPNFVEFQLDLLMLSDMKSTENQLDAAHVDPSFADLARELLQIWPVERWGTAPVIVGVSGGADSVALLRLVAAVAQSRRPVTPLIVGHFNHGLRGMESMADQQFVEKLAGQLGVLVIVETADSPLSRDANEEFLRQQRLDFFKRTANERGARYVLTAHHADDQVETVLFRLMRGTSLAGAAGISPARPLCDGVTLIRPLLNVPKARLLAFLDQLQQPFRTDSSNFSDQYSRNRIRNQLIPRLQADFGIEVTQRIHRFAGQVQEACEWIDEQVQAAVADCCQISSEREVILNREAFQKWPPFLQSRVVVEIWRQLDWPRQNLNHESIGELAARLRLVESPQSFELPGKIRVEIQTATARFNRWSS